LLTRKDIATSLTHKLVLHHEPETAIPISYRSINKVVIGPRCLDDALYGTLLETERRQVFFATCLESITSSESSAAVVYVDIQLNVRMKLDRVLLERLGSTRPIIYSFFDVLFQRTIKYLQLAYSFQAVVHFAVGYGTIQDLFCQRIAFGLEQCLANEFSMVPAGRIFLCDIPSLILTQEEYASSQDVDETAISKLCGLMSGCWPYEVLSPNDNRLEFLKSRVKLVHSGFRPSLADMLDLSLRSVNGNLMSGVC
jgi:hypothetical protein